jgi:hypothetical protein
VYWGGPVPPSIGLPGLGTLAPKPFGLAPPSGRHEPSQAPKAHYELSKTEQPMACPVLFVGLIVSALREIPRSISRTS